MSHPFPEITDLFLGDVYLKSILNGIACQGHMQHLYFGSKLDLAAAALILENETDEVICPLADEDKGLYCITIFAKGEERCPKTE